MTQKDFITIANRINVSLTGTDPRTPTGVQEQEAIMFVARGLADDFAGINRRFNRQRFLLACVAGTDVDPE